jgi:carbonic anhydrase
MSESSNPQHASGAVVTATAPAPTTPNFTLKYLRNDLPAGVVVFLVALPLCLGIALASNAPLASGLIAGVVGALVVGSLSGSHTSVTGPAAGLTAIVASQITHLGSFSAFLTAIVLAGFVQIGLGAARLGSVAAFFPSSVIKGLLAAIGLLLILKQAPHLLGHDPDPVGDLAFEQPDHRTTLSALFDTLFDVQPGATLVGLLSLALLIIWDRVPALKKSVVPAPLGVVVVAGLLSLYLSKTGSSWVINPSHLVAVPLANGPEGIGALLAFPDWTILGRGAVYTAAVTVAIVASLETLLNLEAVDKLDPLQRSSPPNRELLAQGVGNVVTGLLGGLPVTSVVVRGSVNINAGSRTRISAIFHGVLLLACVLLIPNVLNLLPLSSLAAILTVTGFKLVSPKVIKQMWAGGKSQFLPFVVTVGGIIVTDLLRGIVIGLCTSMAFILLSNVRRPVRRVLEKHVGGDVLRIELANQVSFLNRAAIEAALLSVPRGGHVLVDARDTDYIDPDVLDLLGDFRHKTGPSRGVEVSLAGFRERYPQLTDSIQYIDYTTRELQNALTPAEVLHMLKDGNERFRTGHRLTRDLARQATATALAQSPLAVVLSCMDSRSPAELIFDLGIGDVFSIRIAGNVAREKVLASMEYGCVVAGAKLIVVLGHTSCGAVTASLDLMRRGVRAEQATGCDHLHVLVDEIQQAVDPESRRQVIQADTPLSPEFVDSVARRNVQRTMQVVLQRSQALRQQVQQGKVALVGGLYDLSTRTVTFFAEEAESVSPVRHHDHGVVAGHSAAALS